MLTDQVLPSCCQLIVLSFMGPDYFCWRCASKRTRQQTDATDLMVEILRWYCVNTCEKSQYSPLNPLGVIGLEAMGRIPMRCSVCVAVRKQRRVFRCKIGTCLSPRTSIYVCGQCLAVNMKRWLEENEGILKGSFTKQHQLLLITCVAKQMNFRQEFQAVAFKYFRSS